MTAKRAIPHAYSANCSVPLRKSGVLTAEQVNCKSRTTRDGMLIFESRLSLRIEPPQAQHAAQNGSLQRCQHCWRRSDHSRRFLDFG